MAHEATAPASALYSAPPGGQAPSGGQAPCPPSTGAPTRPTPAVPAAVGVAAPLVVVPSAGVAARRGHHSITPGPGPSPCGRARPHVPPVPRRRPS
jgi:hypothetical protein